MLIGLLITLLLGFFSPLTEPVIIIIVLLVIGGCTTINLLSHNVDSSSEESKDVMIK